MTDEQFTETPAFALLCREFEVPASPDAAAYLGAKDREAFFARFDQLKADLSR